MRRKTRVARGVVDVELGVSRAGVPTDEVVQQVVGQRGSGALTAGDVAPTIVTADVDRGGLGGAGGASKISSNLMNAPFYGILMIHLLWLEPPFEQENEFFKSWKIKCDCTQPIDIIHKVKLRILSLLPRKCDKPKCRGLILSILGRPTR